MKTKRIASCRPQARRLQPYQPLFLAAFYLGSLGASQAADGTWTNLASAGVWSDPANWNNAIVADGAGATADFSTLDLGGSSMIILDAPRTLGGLLFGDTAGTAFNWTLGNDGNPANVLTLAGTAPFITVNTGSFTNDVVIAGTSGLTVNGGTAASSLVLVQANTFTGDLTVNAGTVGNLTLFAPNAGALGGSAAASNSIVLVGNTATRAVLRLATSGASYPVYNNLVMRPSGASTSSRAELRSVNGNATWNGTISLDGWSGSSTPRCDIYNDAGSSTLTINGNILDLNAYIGQMSLRGANPGVLNGNVNVPGATVAKDDGGTWTINSETNAWGNTAVLAGTLKLGRENALPAATMLTVGGGSITAVLDLNGFNQTVSGLATGGSNTKRITNSAGAATLIVSNAYDASYSGSILGSVILTKENSGKLTLSGANTYTGDTIVSNGTLAVSSSGTIAGSTNIILGPWTTFTPAGLTLAAHQKLLPLDSTVTIAGALNIGRGTLALDYMVGTPALTVLGGNLSLSDSSAVVIKVSGALTAGESYQLISAVNGGQVSGTTPSSVILNGVSGMSGYLIVSNSQLYLTMDAKPVIASQMPVAHADQFTLFAGASPSFSVTVGGLPPFGYQWFTNGVINTAADNTNSMTWTNVSLGSMAVYCIVTNNSGAATSSVWSASVIAQPTAPYPVAVLSSNLVGYWRLNESDNGLGNGNAGVIAHDYWGGNNGVFNNTLLGQTGYNQSSDPATTSALFGSVDSQNCVARNISGIDFAAPTNSPRAFTVEAWVAGSAPLVPSGIVAKGFGGGGEQFTLDADGPGFGFRFFVRDAAGTARAAASSITPRDSIWHHVVGVCDQPNGAVILYVDGKQAAIGTIPTNAGIQKSTSPMSIGARYSSAASMAGDFYDNQFFGNINDVAIYSRALSAEEVKAHYFVAGIAPSLTLDVPASTNINQNGTLMVQAAATGTEPLSYNWFDVNAAAYIPGQTNATLVVSNLLVANSYYLTVTNAYGSTNSSLLQVGVDAGFNVSMSPAINNQTLYSGLRINFTVSASGTEPFYYRWMTNGVLMAGETNSSYAHTVLVGGNSVSCLVSNSYNGLSSQTLGPQNFTGVPGPTNALEMSVLDDAPVAYWPLTQPDNGLNNGNAGVIAYDYVGGHNGTYTNASLGATGINSSEYPDLTAALFGTVAPTNSYVSEIDLSASGLANLDFATPVGSDATLSVEAWVNLSEAGQGASIVTKGCGHNEQFGLDVNNGAFRFVFRDASRTARDTGVSATAAANTWYHVVGVWDGPNGAGRLFVNGANVARKTGLATGLGLFTPDVNPTLPGASLVNIGSRPSDKTVTDYDVQLRGKIAHVAIYNYALSTNQILAHFTAGTNTTVITPGVLTIANQPGGQVQLVWSFPGTLQTATNAAGPYSDEPSAVSPYAVQTTNAQLFYRVRQK